MKKIIPLFFALLLLFGCSAKNYAPVIKKDFSISAIYKTGDFSYSCNITKQGDTVSITPTSTRAKGLIISCSENEVTFQRNKLKKTFKRDEIDLTNPAVILYEVFNKLENADVKLIDDKFTYTAKTSLGNFVLVQDKNNNLISLSLPEADIEIEFQK